MNKGGGKNNFKMTPEQVQEASKLYDSVKLHALAKKYGVSILTLTRAMRREGLLRPKKRVADRIKLSAEHLQIALTMHQEKKTLDQMSETLNVCKKIIARELTATGQYNNHKGRKPIGTTPKRANYGGEYEPHWSKSLSTDFLMRPLIPV